MKQKEGLARAAVETSSKSLCPVGEASLKRPHIACGSICEISRSGKSTETENGLVVTSGWEEGKMGSGF